MPEANTQPLSLKEYTSDPAYVQGGYDDKVAILDGVESHNLAYMDGLRAKSADTDPNDAVKYADSVQQFRSRVHNERFKALEDQVNTSLDYWSRSKDVPVETLKAQYADPDTHGKDWTPEMKALHDWHAEENEKILQKLGDSGFSPASKQVMKNDAGGHVGEVTTFVDGSGNPKAAVSFAMDQEGQPLPENKRDPAIVVPLKGDRQAALDELEKQKTASTAKLNDFNKKYQQYDEKAKSTDGSSDDDITANQYYDAAKAEGKRLEDLNNKITRYKNPQDGLTNYLQDQVLEKLHTDPGFQKHLPRGQGGDNPMIPGGKTTGISLVPDMAVGIVKTDYETAAAWKLVTGDRAAAKSLAQQAQEMDIAHFAMGMGDYRNRNDIAAQIVSLTSDQAPLLAGQMAAGRLFAVAAERSIGAIVGRTEFGAALTEAVGKDAVGAFSKRWGDKVGAVLGSLPASAQDAAGNISSIYDRVDQLTDEANKLTGGAKEAKMKEAQDLDNKAAGLFLTHFASTELLEYLTLENFLSRREGDISIKAKAMRGAVADTEAGAAMTAADQTQEGVRRAGLFDTKLEKYLTSKIGPRLMEGLEQGTSEAITEAIQAMSDNKIAQQFYDENRDITQGVPQGALGGMYMGAVLGIFAHHAPASSVKAALQIQTEQKEQARRNMQEQVRNIVGRSLEDGTIATPVENVLQKRESDGKFIINDPDMPDDANVPTHFDTAEEAGNWAKDRWENYGKQKIHEVLSQTENAKPEDIDAATQVIGRVHDSLVSGAAGDVSKETVWKALALSLQFSDNDVVEHGAAPNNAIDSVSKALEKNPNPNIQKQLDNYKQELLAWQNNQQGTEPKPAPELAIMMKSQKDIETGPSTNPLNIEYPDIETANNNINKLIPKMSDPQLIADLSSRKARMQNIIDSEKNGGRTEKTARALALMTQEQQAVIAEYEKRKQDQQGGTSANENAAQGSNQGTAQSGTKQASGQQGNGQTGQTLNQGPVHAMKFSDPNTGEKTIDWVESGKKTSTTRNWGKGLPKVGEVITFKEGGKEVPVRVTSVMKLSEVKKLNPEKFFENAAKGEGWTEEQFRGFYEDPKHKTVKDNSHKVMFQRLSAEQAKTPSAPAPQAHFPKEVEQFMKELSDKVSEYNKVLDGQENKDSKKPDKKKETPEATTVKELLGKPDDKTPMFDPVTGKMHPYFVANPPSKGASTSQVEQEKKKGTGTKAPNNITNADGTVNLDRLLAAIPTEGPIGELASTLRELLPLIEPEDKRAKFALSRNEDDAGVTNSSLSGVTVVGDGPVAHDTIGLKSTVSDLIGAFLPRIVDIVLGPKLTALKAGIMSNRNLAAGNPATGFKPGSNSAEASSKSALEVRSVFNLAMPDASDRIRSADDMRQKVTRGLLAKSLNGELPASNDLINAMSQGKATVGTEVPDASTNGNFYVQKSADGRYAFFQKGQDGSWSEITDRRPAREYEKMGEAGAESKLARLYLRSVMAGGHFDVLFGRYDTDGNFLEGVGDTKLTKSEYNEKYGQLGKLLPPYELTSLPRFVEGMLSNPNFSMRQDTGGGWVQDLPARKALFNTVVGDILGATRRATNDQEADAIVGAAMLAANAKRTRELIKRGIPEPSPVRSSIEAHQARLVESQGEGAAYGGQRQNALGASPVQYDENGKPIEGNQPDYEKEAHEYGAAIPPTMQINPRTKRPVEGPYTEAQGRLEQRQGYNRTLTKTQLNENEHEYQQDGLTPDEAAEVDNRIFLEERNHFAAQLALAEKTGALNVKRQKARGEKAIGLTLDKLGLSKKVGGFQMISFTDSEGKVHRERESGSVTLQRVIQSDKVTKKDIDKLLRRLANWMPNEQLQEIGAAWHDFQAQHNDSFREFARNRINRAYKAYASSRGITIDREGKQSRPLTRFEKNQRAGIIARMQAQLVNRITPKGFEPRYNVKGLNEQFFGEPVNDSQESKPSSYVGQPIKSTKNSNVMMSSVDRVYPEQELRTYVANLGMGRIDSVHTALVHLAKVFGIPLSEKDTYENSLKQVRIRPDSLGAWGNLEAILSTITRTSNPKAMQDSLESQLPNGVKKSALLNAAKGDPSMLRDMHAMASSFVDKIANGLSSQGKVVMHRNDPALASREAPIANKETSVQKLGKDVQGPPQIKEQEVAGPYVAIDAQELENDPANLVDVKAPIKEGAALQVATGEKRPIQKFTQKSKTGETFVPVRQSFKMRPARFNLRGEGATASYMNGIVPYGISPSGNKVHLTGDLKMAALGGRSVNDVFREQADTLKANASQQQLRSIYKAIWAQALTTSKRGMDTLKQLGKDVNDARKKSNGSDVPLVSPEVDDNSTLSPASVISELINEYVPKDQVLNQSQNQPNIAGNRRAFINEKTRMITILKKGDPSSLIHEMVHWMRLTNVKGGNSLFKIALGKHYDTFMQWAREGNPHPAGTREGHVWTEEKIAVGAEEFLRRLDSPEKSKIFFDKMQKNGSPKLIEAFKKVGNMMRRIYGNLRSLVQLDTKALNGYDKFFGASERITPAFNKEIDTTPINIDALAPTKEDIRKLREASAQIVGKPVSEELAQRAIEKENKGEGTELMPIHENGNPRTPDDPETLLWQSAQDMVNLSPTTPAGNIESWMRVLFRNGVDKFKEWVLATGGVPWQVHSIMKIKKGGERQTLERTMLKNTKALIDAVQEHLKGATSFGPERNVSREQLHRDVNSYLTEHDTARRAALMYALPSDKIRDAAIALRLHVDNLSLALMSRGIVQGPLAAVINDRLGSYLHASYAITGDMNRRQKLLHGSLNLLYRNAIDVIKSNRGISDVEAREVAEKIIAAGSNPGVKFEKGDPRAQGTSVLMKLDHSWDDVEVARDLLWGKNEDPVLNYQKTVEQMAHLIISDKMMKELLHWGTSGPNPIIKKSTDPRSPDDVAITDFWGDHEQADFATDPIGANVKTVLAGYRTTPEVARYMKEVYDQTGNLNPQLRFYMNTVSTFNGLFKVANTVFNWRTGLRNLYTSSLTVFGNGHLNPMYLAKASQLMFKEGINKDQGADEALMKELLKYNIAESATIAEIKDYAKHGFGSDDIFEMTVGAGNEVLGSKFKRFSNEMNIHYGRGGWLGKMLGAQVKLYQGCDTVAKIASYLSEKDSLKAMFPTWNESQLQEEASRRTHLTMFSFDMTPKLVNFFRKYVPTSGPFISFTWSMLRSSINILKLAGDDIAQGTQRKMAGEAGGVRQVGRGLTRLASYATMAATGELIAKMMMSSLGWDKDMMDKLRSAVPDWDKRGNLVPTSSPDDDNIEYVNMSTVLPFNVVSDMAMSFFRNEGSSPWDKVSDAALVAFKPFLEDEYVTQAYRILQDQRDQSGGKIVDSSMGPWDKAQAYLSALTQPLIPGTAKNLLRMDLAPEGPGASDKAGHIISKATLGLAKEGDLAQQAGSLANSLGIQVKPMTTGRKVEYAMGLTHVTLDKKQLYLWQAREWANELHSPVAQFTRMMQSANQFPQETLEAHLNKAIDTQQRIIEEGRDFTLTMRYGFNVHEDVVKKALKDATQYADGVSGGHLSQDQQEALAGHGNPPNGINISKQQFLDIMERAGENQPMKAVWLEQWKNQGLIKVTER